MIGKGNQTDVRLVSVEDPFERGRKLNVARNVRTHPLEEELANCAISEDQYNAGNRFLRLYEQAEIGGAQAIDYTVQKVDTSFVHKGLPLHVMTAAKDLKDIRHFLGRRSYDLLVAVIGNRVRIEALAREASGGNGWQERLYRKHMRLTLAETLQELVSHFGVVARGNARARIRAETTVTIEDLISGMDEARQTESA